MEFKDENSMVAFFKEKFVDYFGINENQKILEEVGLGFGIADLVISELNQLQLNSLEREPLTPIDIGIYKIIEKQKKITIDRVFEITRGNRKKIKDSLEKLIRGSYIEKVNSYYIFTNKYELSFKKSIAIEAKLKNWKRALMQAYRYRWFADYSYVVLDHAHVETAIENIDSFKKLNIGLISISTEGHLFKHHLPKRQKPIDAKMQILLSEALIYSS